MSNYTENNPFIKDMKNFMFNSDIAIGMNVIDFLKYSPEGSSSTRNIDSLFERYTELNKDGVEGYSKSDLLQYERIKLSLTQLPDNTDSSVVISQLNTLPVPYLTKFEIPLDQVERSAITQLSNITVKYPEFKTFVASELALLFNDTGWDSNKEFQSLLMGSAKDIFPNISIWLWSKSICSRLQNEKIVYEDVLLNLSPFVSFCSTTVDGNDGNFRFTVAEVEGVYDEEKQIWQLSDSIFNLPNEFVSETPLFIQRVNADGDTVLMLNKFFLEQAIQENDVVFIRYETLPIEEGGIDAEKDEGSIRVKRRSEQNNEVLILKKHLPNQIYDMIGLVDQADVQTSFAGSDIRIDVNGRDLMKLLIEDGNYFYAFDYISGSIFANESSEEYLQRYDGKLLSKFHAFSRSIDASLKFIFNALGRIRVTSDTLFDAYKQKKEPDGKEKDVRTYRYKIASETTEARKRLSSSIENATNNAKSLISDSVFQSDIENANVEQILTDLKDFVSDEDNVNGTTNKLTDSGLTAFSSEFNDKFFADSSPLDISIRAAEEAKNILDIEQSLREVDVKFESAPHRGIWQIVKLCVDVSLANRRVVDGSLGNDLGSLINSVRKVCQDPFVEFWGDTYGDQYYFIARKPPFDEVGYKGMITGKLETEVYEQSESTENSLLRNQRFKADPDSGQQFIKPNIPIVESTDERITDKRTDINKALVITIKADDVISFNPNYGDPSQAYSWYRLQPQGSFPGGSTMQFAYLKAVYFREYAEIFGSKPLDVVSNYLPYYPYVSKDSKINLNAAIKQAVYDLKYLIQSHAYLPFVRQDRNCQINYNRTIKRGTIVYFELTDEYYYVSGVNHNYNISDSIIDGTTSLNLQRGMVRKYLDKYFELIDAEIDDEKLKTTEGYATFNKEIIGKWKVNPEVFQFFLNKQQFK